jgi:hypothetical protein
VATLAIETRTVATSAKQFHSLLDAKVCLQLGNLESGPSAPGPNATSEWWFGNDRSALHRKLKSLGV